MGALINFLRNLFVRTPQEILVALLRAIFIFLLILIILLLRIWEWLMALLKRRNLYPEEPEEPCGRLPEAVVRRPDPCIYSQRLLQSQGLPVTWNNPDIWMARADNPGNIEPDSYHLTDDTDYIVTVRIHNASIDPAIGVRVRLNYRPWSFNSPDLVPVEADANGNEVFQFVDVGPMASSLVQFNWHTPPIPTGQDVKHYCLQASLYHPMDVNTSNNMGQENTNVYRSENPGFVAAGQEIELETPLFNHARRAQQFRFEALKYEIEPEDRVELKLKTTLGYAKWSLSQRIANLMPTLQIKNDKTTRAEFAKPGTWRFIFERRPQLQAVKQKYVGFEELREKILARDYSLPQGMTIAADGQPMEKGLDVSAKESRAVKISIRVPDDAEPGSTVPVTLLAFSADGVLAGGITVIITVKEGN